MTRIDVIEDFLQWLASQRYKGYDTENNMLLVGRNFKWKSAIEVYKNEVLLIKEN